MVVAVAIVCIIEAALTSAQRADEVALEREKHLFMKAAVNHGEWSMRRLKSVVDSDQATHGNDLDQAGGAPGRIVAWLKPLLEHDFVLMIGSADRVLYAQGAATAFSQVRSLLEYLRGRTSVLPDSTFFIAKGEAEIRNRCQRSRVPAATHGSDCRRGGRTGSARRGGSACRPAARRDDDAVHRAHAAVQNRDRLQLDNLRKDDGEAVPADDNVFNLVDRHQTPIVRFAWTPKRPAPKS